jgi:chemotaxis protein MotD
MPDMPAVAEERPRPPQATRPAAGPTAPASDHTPAAGRPSSDFALAFRAQPEQPPPETMPFGLQTPRDFGQLMAATAQTVAQGQSPSVPAPVPLDALAVEIAARAQAGRSRFEIRLDPPELGRIEVRLDIDRGGQITSRLIVERAETLDVLRRDAHELERAFQQAGLKTADNGLQFTLRDQAFAGDDGKPSHAGQASTSPDAESAQPELTPAGYSRVLYARGGVDIRI